MDFLRSHKNKTFVSEMLYMGLNLGLAAALFVLVQTIGSPLPAVLLVLISKWRILAVRPRFWAANILANSVDIIVSLSVVFLLYAASDKMYAPVNQSGLYAQIGLTVLYAVWLLFIKPSSKRIFVAIQAGTALFLGVTSVMMMAYALNAGVTVLLLWIIGYSAARHVLTSYDEKFTNLYSIIGGLIVAEIGWLTNHWTFAYAVPGIGGLRLVQVAIIVTLLGFVAERAYASYDKHHHIEMNDILLPSLLTLSVIFLLVLFFNSYGVLGSGTV
jgi:hypothetical protein